MPSEKVLSADYQQERLKMIGWIVGFVDGEGCFGVSIFKNHTTSLGWQSLPEFVVSQEKKSLYCLKKIKKFFGRGKIFINRRFDNHKEDLYRYCVRSLKDLETKIIPFFERNPLQTAKKEDFKKFKKIIFLMKKGCHLKKNGLKKISRIVQTMNNKKPSQFLVSPETIRQNH